MIRADYLVVGAGATGMAFADAILTETDTTLAIVDRYGKPGGHWTRSYPHVRLHQPSAFYGVNSRQLGTGRKDTLGGNAGLFELASGSEVATYFDQLMQQQFLPSGRVQYFPMSEYAEGGAIVSLVSGERQTVEAKKVVDATASRVTIPAMRHPPYDVAAGVHCVPPNALTALDWSPSGYVVIGGGKTGIDACLWLLDAGVPPARIRWIVPRDAWLLDRQTLQPTNEFFTNTVGGFANQFEASALATSVEELFERLEACGQLLRLDRNVQPTMYRCATVSLAELDQLRTLPNIVRMGHVQSITQTEIGLDGGSIPTDASTLHIDCTGDGLGRLPAGPVFRGDRITVQNVRLCQPAFSAAFVGHVEAAYDDDELKNELCTPIPFPDAPIDWLTMALANARNMDRWNADPQLASWLRESRLDVYTKSTPANPPTEEQIQIIGKIGKYRPAAIENLARLIATGR
jgi:hypothetical protein